MPSLVAESESATPSNFDAMEESTIEVEVDASMSRSTTASNEHQAGVAEHHAHSDRGEDAISNLDGASDASTPSTGPRRGALFTSDIPPGHAVPRSLVDLPPFDNPVQATVTKADLHTTLSTSLAPKSGILASQHMSQTGHHDEQLTDSDPEFRDSVPLTQPPRSTDAPTPPPSYMPPPPQGYYSTYKLESNLQMPPPKREPKTSARRVKQYTLSDGTVVSGKGLGRGRPGVKRGPRNPKYTIVDPDSLPESDVTHQISQSPAHRPLPNRKRKRANSDASNVKTTFSASTSYTSESRESSVEYNPIEETKSGRKIQKPVTVASIPDIASPASKRPKLEDSISASISPSVLKNHPKIKRRIYRGREQLALCEHCLRGHGPPGNVIVFCDACNKCWHQRCHDPQVPQTIIADTKAEWFCSDCDRILHAKKGRKAAAAAVAKLPTIPSTEPAAAPAFSGPLIGGAALNHAQKQSYLHSLAPDKLITLILSASELAPALPLFQAPAPQLPQAKFTSNYTTPVSSTTIHHTAASAADDDEGYDSHFDEHAYLYPKPGEGVKLPPESVDLHILLESKESGTFSHWVRGMSGVEFSGTADVGRGGEGHAHG